MLHFTGHVDITAYSYGETAGVLVKRQTMDGPTHSQFDLNLFSTCLEDTQDRGPVAERMTLTGENSCNWCKYPFSQPTMIVAGDVGCHNMRSTLDLNRTR